MQKIEIYIAGWRGAAGRAGSFLKGTKISVGIIKLPKATYKI